MKAKILSEAFFAVLAWLLSIAVPAPAPRRRRQAERTFRRAGCRQHRLAPCRRQGARPRCSPPPPRTWSLWARSAGTLTPWPCRGAMPVWACEANYTWPRFGFHRRPGWVG